MLRTEENKKKRDEQTAAERTKIKKLFHFPQDFLGLGRKCLGYQKPWGEGKSQW